MTQVDLAERLGLERTSIANIEGGVQRTPLHILYKLCQVLGIDTDQLLPRLEEVEVSAPEPEREVVVGAKIQMLPPKTSAFILRQTARSKDLPKKAATFVKTTRRGDKQ